MSHLDLIVWEKRKREHEKPSYVQIPLPLQPLPQKKPPNNEKDKEKRGVYIFQM